MKKNLFTIERAVVQNVFHPKQAVYRGLEAVSGLFSWFVLLVCLLARLVM